jgi:2,3-bisphosphoglycerate-independent phosphoglycerate mutase
VRTAAALRTCLRRAHAVLDAHPVNRRRRDQGLVPMNFLATQRGGQVRPRAGFGERHGLRAALVASGGMFRGLARCTGMEWIQAREHADPGTELAARLEQAREALQTFDFVHVHTKAPDQAAHTKDCLRKRDVIESLDRGAGCLSAMAEDPELLLAVTADHSTPSAGALIHSGEPVPLLLHGRGVRRDAVARFDEVSAATGCLGLLRGSELMLLLLNHLDRARLVGLRDSPAAFADAPAWPARYEPFTLE